MDIRRIRADDEFKYADKKTKKRVNKRHLKTTNHCIPPSYKKVKISSNQTKVQVIGIDDLGRKQYIYNPKFIEEQQKLNFKI